MEKLLQEINNSYSSNLFDISYSLITDDTPSITKLISKYERVNKLYTDNLFYINTVKGNELDKVIKATDDNWNIKDEISCHLTREDNMLVFSNNNKKKGCVLYKNDTYIYLNDDYLNYIPDKIEVFCCFEINSSIGEIVELYLLRYCNLYILYVINYDRKTIHELVFCNYDEFNKAYNFFCSLNLATTTNYTNEFIINMIEIDYNETIGKSSSCCLKKKDYLKICSINNWKQLQLKNNICLKEDEYSCLYQSYFYKDFYSYYGTNIIYYQKGLYCSKCGIEGNIFTLKHCIDCCEKKRIHHIECSLCSSIVDIEDCYNDKRAHNFVCYDKIKELYKKRYCDVLFYE